MVGDATSLYKSPALNPGIQPSPLPPRLCPLSPPIVCAFASAQTENAETRRADAAPCRGFLVHGVLPRSAVAAKPRCSCPHALFPALPPRLSPDPPSPPIRPPPLLQGFHHRYRPPSFFVRRHSVPAPIGGPLIRGGRPTAPRVAPGSPPLTFPSPRTEVLGGYSALSPPSFFAVLFVRVCVRLWLPR
jgi:hypothetical protein